ncbi:MAG TPA: peptidylprolyl isomerase [Myxococcales bacterium]|jgi:FKBP-type peptidyl-prolyl cis-trans isomerase SlyD|nr:peptidylprolyl isomerase [Myxococcales bacterium]
MNLQTTRTSTQRVREGRVISLEYRVRLSTGELVESTGKVPIDYLHGGGQILPALERALEGLREGERTSFSIAPEDAYGTHDEGNVVSLARSMFPVEAALKPGLQLLARASSGQTYPITIRELHGDTVTVDLNHPLAGERLFFEVAVTSVRLAADEELFAGKPRAVETV